MTTPEGKIKAKVKEILSHYDYLYFFMPVQYGMGATGLDFHCMVNAEAFFIETKANNKRLTVRQEALVEELRSKKAKVFVIRDDNGFDELKAWLDERTRST
jgi:hypothetical protein